MNPQLSTFSRQCLHRVLIMLPVLVSAAIVITPNAAQAHEPTCQRRDTTVTLSPDSAVRYRIAGWMCRPARPTSAVQVLVSSFTYDHNYWSLTGSGRSYVSAALRAGTAVYTVDRVGVGASDRPPADEVTAMAEAFVAHQLVQQLRHEPRGFRHVIGVGHSYGSAIWMIEAANHHDVDALILTGYLHQANPVQQAAIAASLSQASEDPLFANNPPPPGYVTTRPGARGPAFYYLPGADDAALTVDEQTKATGTTGQRATMSLARDPSYSRNITVPVLLVVGDHDALSCDTAAGLSCSTAKQICARERAYYPPRTPVYAAVVPNAGHSINGHRTASVQSSLVNAWARTATSRHAVAWSKCQA